MIRLATLVPMAGLCLALALSACGSSNDGDAGTQVTASTGILADITQRLAGEDAEVTQLVPDGASPHDFELSAQDRAQVEDSALLVYNGAGLEAGIPVEEIGQRRFALSERVGPLLPFGEGEGDGDPHLWMDPTRVTAALPALAAALAEADPAHASGYMQRAKAFAVELKELDREIAKRMSAIPAADRELVTSHDALGYFADRYGLEVVATAFPASGPEAEASAASIAEAEKAIERAQVPAVFAEESDDPEALEQIADRTGVAIVDGLLVEFPGSAGTYVAMLREDAALIADALG